MDDKIELITVRFPAPVFPGTREESRLVRILADRLEENDTLISTGCRSDAINRRPMIP